MSGSGVAATQRLAPKRQTLDEAYAPPANFLEIEVVNPITHGVGKSRYTDYEIRLRVSSFLLSGSLLTTSLDHFLRAGVLQRFRSNLEIGHCGVCT
uniref:Sorting nexin-12 n=1 Tax=Ascaris suum TaxID=6253 RepID=F1LAC5_ASCSU